MTQIDTGRLSRRYRSRKLDGPVLPNQPAATAQTFEQAMTAIGQALNDARAKFLKIDASPTMRATSKAAAAARILVQLMEDARIGDAIEFAVQAENFGDAFDRQTRTQEDAALRNTPGVVIKPDSWPSPATVIFAEPGRVIAHERIMRGTIACACQHGLYWSIGTTPRRGYFATCTHCLAVWHARQHGHRDRNLYEIMLDSPAKETPDAPHQDRQHEDAGTEADDAPDDQLHEYEYVESEIKGDAREELSERNSIVAHRGPHLDPH